MFYFYFWTVNELSLSMHLSERNINIEKRKRLFQSRVVLFKIETFKKIFE